MIRVCSGPLRVRRAVPASFRASPADQIRLPANPATTRAFLHGGPLIRGEPSTMAPVNAANADQMRNSLCMGQTLFIVTNQFGRCTHRASVRIGTGTVNGTISTEAAANAHAAFGLEKAISRSDRASVPRSAYPIW